jgi:spore coat protein CotH
MKNILLCLLFAVVFVACKKQDGDGPGSPVEVENGIKFYLDAKSNAGKLDTTRIPLTMAGDSVVGVVPALSDEKSFVISFEPATANVKINGVAQKSGVTVNDFSNPIIYTYTNPRGETKNLKVAITNFTGLPIFYINTAAPVVSKDNYVSGSLRVNANGQFIQTSADISLNIKGRGNSTWDMPKKPYRLKFNSKLPLLGLPSAKNWVLLANYSDKTLLRNALAFDIAHQLGADFTPHYRFVEVIMNGQYAGSYLLTEQVEVNPGRVAIHEMSADDETGSQLTGGYLLEIDQNHDADVYFRSNHNLPFCIKSPDEITDKQLAYIHNYVQQTEDAIYSDNFANPSNGYAKYINVDSFISWYLVNELVKNVDGQSYSSIFYYKDVNGKLGMGPVWDFDIAAGNCDGETSNPTGWWIRDAEWFYRLCQDPAFKARVRERWEKLKPALPAILLNIEENSAYLHLSQKQNFQTWDILNTHVWPNPEVAGTYLGEVEYLKAWMELRINWMDLNL